LYHDIVIFVLIILITLGMSEIGTRSQKSNLLSVERLGAKDNPALLYPHADTLIPKRANFRNAR